jgi:hypothetical protein
MLQIALIVGVAAAGLSSSALNGWLSNIPPNEHKKPLGKWMNIAVFSGTGLLSAAASKFARRPARDSSRNSDRDDRLPSRHYIPAPGPDGRLNRRMAACAS